MSDPSTWIDTGVDLTERDHPCRCTREKFDDEVVREKAPDVDPSVLITPEPEIKHRISRLQSGSHEAELLGEAFYRAEWRSNYMSGGECRGIDADVGL
jgi:hypothetical protein